MKQEHFDITPGFENGEFTPEQALKFYDELKIFHVGALVSSALQMKRNFRANWSTVPPFMRKEYMGKTIYNTETKKDTRYLDSKVIFGEQQLLFEMLQEGTFSMDELSKTSKNKIMDKRLQEVMVDMGFTKSEISQLKTKVSKQGAILDLYESVRSGYSQCHYTGNRLRANGGW